MAVALLLAVTSSAPGADSALRWPLDLTPALSSTFGETRPTNFHAGIDLKTWGRTGYEVHAVADGWIQGARTSPFGYGRSLYQRLADGRTAVYAHLQEFSEPVAGRVRAAQRQRRRYSVDLWLEEGEVPVARGQVIARTGDSGAGPPHLHLEIRDADNVPVNPLLAGLGGNVKDTTPPTLKRLLVVPVGPESTVDGDWAPVSVALAWTPSAQRYDAARAVRAWGRIGLAVDCHDRADASDNRLAALSHTLIVDGRPALTARYARVSYEDRHQVALDRLRPGAEAGGGVFAALFRRPGNRLPFYEIPGKIPGARDGTLPCGAGGLSSGDHVVEVVAADAAGNERRARLTLTVAAPPRIAWAHLRSRGDDPSIEAQLEDEDSQALTAELARSPDGKTWELSRRERVEPAAGPLTWSLPGAGAFWRLAVEDGSGAREVCTLIKPSIAARPAPLELAVQARARPRHAVLDIRAPRPLSALPQVEVAGGTRPLRARQVGDWTYRAVVPLDLEGLEGDGASGDSASVRVGATAADGGTAAAVLVLSRRAVGPGAAGSLRFLGGRVEVRLDSGSAYEVLYPQARPIAPRASAGLRSTGFGCVLDPPDAVFDRQVQVWLAVPQGQAGSGRADRLGVYADGGDGRWVFAGNEREDAGRRVGARVRGLGRYALMADETPPSVGDLRPAAGAVVGQRPRCAASVRDAGSGIGSEEDVIMELDGVRLISEYDPEAGRVVAEPDSALANGGHALVVTVRDRAGNQTRAAATFRVGG